jgi:7-cyano-7-deazaguanine synthase in queuosine biosynthesis
MKINVVCNYRHLPESRKGFEIAEKAVYLADDPDYGNVNFHPGMLALELGRELDPLSLDLCEIAIYIYLADKAIPRGEYDNWARNLSFLIPVRRPAKWNSVKRLLRNTIATLSGDNVQFHFLSRKEQEKSGQIKPVDRNIRSPDIERSDSVCLFSGGLDSFAGAVHLIGAGRRPLFVSHYANALLKNLQSNLLNEIQNKSGAIFGHLQYRVTSKKSRDANYTFKARESSHRARSFMFMSFASVAAALRNLEDIYICENGVLALNVPISEARKGSRSTRHAHPLYLQYFGELITQLYGREFSIQNPFLFWTKGREAALLKDNGFGPVVKDTVSCWGYPNQTIRFKNSKHCGHCIPCIVRRVSLAAANLEQHDDRYIRDVFSAPGERQADRYRNFFDLVYFCQRVASLSASELVYKYPEFVMIEADQNSISDDKVAQIVQVYKQFAEEVLALAKT